MARKLSLTFVGTGKLATCLVPALAAAGYTITEIASRSDRAALAHARVLARRVGARAVPLEHAALNTDAVWLAVPDREIRNLAASIALRLKVPTRQSKSQRIDRRLSDFPLRFAFHSSGALASNELASLRKAGLAVASLHPLMTFVSGVAPALTGVPFAIEGDALAVKAAQTIVRSLGGNSFRLAPRRKAAYHAWATMTSPLLLAYLATLEKAARAAGINPVGARRMSLPILQQTLTNYSRMGSARSFTGPFARGDVATVEKHLAKLDLQSRAVYLALARAALKHLPVGNQKAFRKLLENA